MTSEFADPAAAADLQPHGWSGSITRFLSKSNEDILDSLSSYYGSSFSEEVGQSQKNAWAEQLNVLHRELAVLTNLRPDSKDWSLILEYELPRERGRRPDVILLAGPAVIVLEFKGHHTTSRVAVDQLQAYAKDIQHYHSVSHERTIHSLLVLSRGEAVPAEFEKIWIVYRQDLGNQLAILQLPAGDSVSLMEWLASPYVPLPSLVTAARTIFEHDPLPPIRRAESAGIPEALDALRQAAAVAKQRGERHLALVTGVPGAGKTLVGLQFVYGSGIEASEGIQDAIFLSGNGPLVKVLQYALKSSVFVRDVHGFLKQYGGNKRKTPNEHIWVYDEAQRAWDVERVRESRSDGFSEPEDFVRLADRMPDWALVVGLIGEGQEINRGEESGLVQWNDALTVLDLPWTVHTPKRLASLFTEAHSVIENDGLDLTESLRSHLAQEVPQWIVAVLEGRFDVARELMTTIAEQGFDAYVTRDLAAAQMYLQQRYAGHESKRYGLLASSKANNLDKYGIRNGFMYSSRVRIGQWYNDPPMSPDSCCQFREVATEFSSQGLELDFPLVCWGDDLRWEDGWISKPVRDRRDPHQLKLNSYRVLLSRGRDGFIVWVPPEDKPLDLTYEAFVSAGLRILS
jgi:hypothetical protein